MTLSEFKNLEAESQACEVFEFGINVHECSEGNCMYILYNVHSFYVEKIFDTTTGNLIRMAAFDFGCKSLDRYIIKINLPY